MARDRDISVEQIEELAQAAAPWAATDVQTAHAMFVVMRARATALEDAPGAWEEKRAHCERCLAAARHCVALIEADIERAPTEADRQRRREEKSSWLRFAHDSCAGAIVALGTILHQAGDLGLARLVSIEALATYPNTAFTSHLHFRLADLANYEGDWEAADRHLTAAWEHLGDREFFAVIRPMIMALRGVHLLDLGLPDRAAPWLHAARDETERVRRGDSNANGAQAILLAALARLRLEYREYRELIEDVDAALADPANRAMFGGHRAWLCRELQARQAIACAALARVEPAFGPRAEQLFERVIESADAKQNDRLLARLGMAERLIGRERWSEAAAQLDLVEDVISRMGNGAARAGPRRQAASVQASRARIALGRGVGEVELRRESTALESALAGLVDSWRSLPPRPGGVGLFASDTVREVLSMVVRLRLAQEDPEGALQQLVSTSDVGTLVRRMNGPRVDLAAIRAELLGARTGALIYLPSLDRTHVFALDATQLDHIEIAEATPRLDLLRAFAGAVRQSPRGLPDDAERARRRRDLARDGQEIARWLLPAAVRARVATWDHVLIVGRELLENVPFDALPWTSRAPLGVAKALSYLPSLSLGVALERRRAEAVGGALDMVLAAAPVHGDAAAEQYPNLRALPWTAADTRALLAPFPAGQRASYTGADAGIDTLRAAVRRTRMVHFVTHGIRDHMRERYAGLLLAPKGDDPGFLWSEAAERLSGPEVVLLSACGPGRGPHRAGDAAAAHLGGAFLLASAQCVVLPAAAVAFRPTLRLMTHVHAHLANDVAPAEALRRARAALCRDPRHDDPHDWALVHALGIGHRAPP